MMAAGWDEPTDGRKSGSDSVENEVKSLSSTYEVSTICI
jgi:hypothetical protein